MLWIFLASHLVMQDSPSLVAKRVFVDSYDISVGEDLHKLRPDAPQVIGHDQRGCQHCPDSHLDPGLLIAEGKVPNNELRWRELFHFSV